nr:MAG TPA: hypothetical protein [Caudoviricetes sp.]DAM90040.1 MAG TPA: hypothetical protein [Caudoviricetes sp.]
MFKNAGVTRWHVYNLLKTKHLQNTCGTIY